MQGKTALLTGGSGFIGRALTAALQKKGVAVRKLSRSPHSQQSNEFFWSPNQDDIDANALEGTDMLIHLAGENIFGRWTSKKKENILESRVRSTTLLAKTIAKMSSPPEVVLSASAIGYYGERADEMLHEQSPAGNGFLSEVCQKWEEAAQPIAHVSRLLTARIGIVLHPSGGALGQMLPFFRLGLGGRLAGGKHYMSWISRADLVRAFLFLLSSREASGPFNVTAPEPVQNTAFTSELGRAINRPTVFPVPAPALRLLYGEMADDVLLSSTRVFPARLLDMGFDFQAPTLPKALKQLFGSNDDSS